MVEAEPSKFKARYPEFSDVSDDVIAMVMVEASPTVGDDWEEVDKVPALMALTAHLLSQQGYPQRLSTNDGKNGGGFNPNTLTNAVTRRKVGDVEVQFGSSTMAGSGTSNGGNSPFEIEMNQTVYGQAFLRFMRRNVNTIFVV